MSVQQLLLAQLARFDDEAYVALANRGLLRRAYKDLEKQDIAIVEETPLHLIVGFGEHRIRFDAQGPAAARCSCPAGGVCQHILAASIALQRMGDAAGAKDAPATSNMQGDESAGGEGADANAMAGLHAALLAFSHEELVKHAGKPGYRWAWQFVQDLDPEKGVMFGGERHIVIGFQHPRMTLRYMGGGIGSLVADVQTAHLAKHQVAAVLAYRRAHGVEDPAVESSARAKTGVLDLGKDHALSETGAEAQDESRARLLASVRQLLEDCVELGLSHLSGSIHERFSTMAVWAQGAEYYRLAALLRRLADHVEMLLERAGGADEHRLYDEMAFAYGLVAALDAARQKASAPQYLVGQARSRYEETAVMDILGLGAHAWRSASGYVGLTMLFWSPADKTFYACTDARPELQRGFNPVARYHAPWPWSGLGAPAAATGRRLRLNGAKSNAQRRLSATEATQADVRPADDFIGQLLPYSSWSELAEARAGAGRSLLAEPEPMADWAVLAPESFGRARFDAAQQKLVWPLLDSAGKRLDLELYYSEYTDHAIRRIEQLSTEGVRPGSLLVARIRHTSAGLVGEPLSIIWPAGQSENPVDALNFDLAPRESTVSRWLSKLRSKENPAGAEDMATAVNFDAHHHVFTEFKRWLQRLAESGFSEGNIEPRRREFTVELERIASCGYTVLQSSYGKEKRFAELLLQANYICMQYERVADYNRSGSLEG